MLARMGPMGLPRMGPLYQEIVSRDESLVWLGLGYIFIEPRLIKQLGLGYIFFFVRVSVSYWEVALSNEAQFCDIQYFFVGVNVS